MINPYVMRAILAIIGFLAAWQASNFATTVPALGAALIAGLTGFAAPQHNSDTPPATLE